MTRPGHRLDFFDRHAPVRKPTTTNPWSGYLDCEECGAPAGTTCMGLDDKPAVEVCDGRMMSGALDDSKPVRRGRPTVARTPTGPAVGTSERALQRRKAGTTEPPAKVPCSNCGEMIRKWGNGGRRWCHARECRQAKRRASASPPARYDRSCEICGASFVAATNDRKYCGAACRRVGFRSQLFDVVVRCFFCDAAIGAAGPAASRQTAKLPACKDAACRRARNRAWAQTNRRRQARGLHTDCVWCGGEISVASCSPVRACKAQDCQRKRKAALVAAWRARQ